MIKIVKGSFEKSSILLFLIVASCLAQDSNPCHLKITKEECRRVNSDKKDKEKCCFNQIQIQQVKFKNSFKIF
jgi:hypothetical protein